MRISSNFNRSSARRTAPARAVLSERASTLIEVLVAGMLLVVVAASLYGAFSSGFYLIQSTRENLRATQILLQQMEILRLYTWSQVQDTNYVPRTSFLQYYDPVSQTNGGGGMTYTVKITMSNNPSFTPPAVYSPNMLLVKVQVSWLSGQVQRQREMSTYISQAGLQNYVWNN